MPAFSRTCNPVRGLTRRFRGEDFTPAVISVPRGDPDIEASVLKAQSKLPELRERFRNGLNSFEALLVKHPLVDADDPPRGVKVVWSEVISWDDEDITAILAVQPKTPGARRIGSAVSFKTSEIVDYMIAAGLRTSSEGDLIGKTVREKLFS